MDQPHTAPPTKPKPPLWQAILLVMALVFGIVILFTVLLYVFMQIPRQMGWPVIANIVIFVIISGIFAWLVKRLTNIVAGFSQIWFPEEDEEG